MRSSAGAGVKGPFKAGANEAACGGLVLVGAGAGGAVETTESAGGGSVDTGAGAPVGYVCGATVPTDGGGGATDTGFTKGGTVSGETAAG